MGGNEKGERDSRSLSSNAATRARQIRTPGRYGRYTALEGPTIVVSSHPFPSPPPLAQLTQSDNSQPPLHHLPLLLRRSNMSMYSLP